MFLKAVDFFNIFFSCRKLMRGALNTDLRVFSEGILWYFIQYFILYINCIVAPGFKDSDISSGTLIFDEWSPRIHLGVQEYLKELDS